MVIPGNDKAPQQASIVPKVQEPVVVAPDTLKVLKLGPVTPKKILPVPSARPYDYFFKGKSQFDNSGFTVVDDDILVTFASFSYTKVPAFLMNTQDEEVLIRADMYTSINVSKGMRKMMKKMYEVRRNGKPTHRARKQKRRLVSWQKDDAKHFDKDMTNNPLDIIDLADFIFQK
jgi:hypothetical protein